MILVIQYVVLNFESVDEILWCYHSNETSSSAVLSYGTIHLVYGPNFGVCGMWMKSYYVTIQMKRLQQ